MTKPTAPARFKTEAEKVAYEQGWWDARLHRAATPQPVSEPGSIAPRVMGPVLHDLKCAAGYYEAIQFGHKTAELRFNDRDFRPHDILRLHEIEFGRVTGHHLDRRITHIEWDSNGPWLAPGHCMLSLGVIAPSPTSGT